MWCVCVFVCECSQVRHAELLDQVAALQVAQRDAAELSALVTQLQLLKGDGAALAGLVAEVDRVRADNAALHRKSLTLPSLQAEYERLRVRDGVLQEAGSCVVLHSPPTA